MKITLQILVAFLLAMSATPVARADDGPGAGGGYGTLSADGPGVGGGYGPVTAVTTATDGPGNGGGY